jgi:hypothetical protein
MGRRGANADADVDGGRFGEDSGLCSPSDVGSGIGLAWGLSPMSFF